MRERERERQSERDREKESEKERQRDRQGKPETENIENSTIEKTNIQQKKTLITKFQVIDP